MFLAASLLLACSPTQGPAAGDTPPLWQTSTAEPYPFVTPIPPVEPTVIDGIYRRKVPVRVAGSSVPCRRCAPYRIEVGETTLELDKGRFFITHRAPGKPDSSQFSSRGHFTVSDGTLTLFNDANCPRARGSYHWSLRAGRLVFRAIDDACPFSQLRKRFLTALPWELEA